MQTVKAQLNSYRQSPRKVRVVADLIRGKRVEDAMLTLTFTTKRASKPLEKLLASAVANAKNLSLPLENLVVKQISVDGGAILYRRRPRSRGMANPIRKRTSHISITLALAKEQKTKNKKQKKPLSVVNSSL